MHFPNLLHVIPEKWRKTAAWAALALLAAALLFNAFAGLGAAEIRNWDEARHAISAWEMLNGGNLLVNTFRFEPDYWNVKPVLAFWPSAAGFRLFGFNLFGMRFFQALALVLIAGISFEAVRRAAGWAAALVTLGFLTVNPAVFSHSFRNADADAAYMLFFMLFFWGKAKDKAAYRREHESQLILYEAAAKAIKDAGVTKLPNLAALKAEYRKLDEEKERLYRKYGEVKKELADYGIIKQNVDSILRVIPHQERTQEL